MVRQTCDATIGLPGEDYHVAIRKWEVIKRKVTIHEQRLTLMCQGSGDLSRIYYWLNQAEALLESYENLQDADEGITALKYRIERHKVQSFLFLHCVLNSLYLRAFLATWMLVISR